MVTSDNAGKPSALFICICDSDLQRRSHPSAAFAVIDVGAEAFAELVKAFQEGNSPAVDTLLRRWGVWR